MFADSIWEIEKHVFTEVGKNIVDISKLRI